MAGGTLTPLAPLTMQELKLSQTLDGANMSPYHTTGEFAASVFYGCFISFVRIIHVTFHSPNQKIVLLIFVNVKMQEC